MDWFARRHARGRPPHPDILTPAEWRVLEEVRAGRSNAEIAERLDVSVNTVRTHVSSMLAKLDLPDRHALAQWDGEPAVASTRRMGRLALVVGASAGVVALAAVFWVALDGARGTSGGVAVEETPTPTAEAAATEAVATPAATDVVATASASPTATSVPAAPPYRLEFAAGEEIDVLPAVVFVDTQTGDAEAWVFPEAVGEFGVGPSGRYILWQHRTDRRMHLYRTDNQTDRILDGVQAMPLAYGPGDEGFLALTRSGGILSQFDGHGEHAGDVLHTGRSTVAAWGPRALAYGGGALRIWIRETPQAAGIQVVDDESDSQVSLGWSPSGDLLAVVTPHWVRVFDLEGSLLWEQRESFWGNPRWSPTGEFLYVNAMPGARGDVAYLFTSDGEPLFRYVAEPGNPYGYGCAGEVWLDEETVGIGQAAVTVAGDIRDMGGQASADPAPEDFGVRVSTAVGWHTLHAGPEDYLRFTDDGRFVFSTILGGHGGCASGLFNGPVLEPGLERPPYEPF